MCGTFGGTGVMLKTWRDRHMRYGHCTTTFNQITIYILTNMFTDSVFFLYQHLSAEELALRREEMKKQPKPYKMFRYRG